MSAVDVVTDLLGEIVEIYTFGSTDYSLLTARGTVRAVYLAEGRLRMLVEHNLGYESAVWQERLKNGGFGVYDMLENRVRAAQRCKRCAAWDQKALLAVEEGAWEHRAGVGCKEVGYGA
jgi:hypothetical protein